MAEAHARQIVIAGAGIAGLTAALAFAARGFSVRLLESAPELRQAGAGIQLSPNATRILGQLGVLETIAAAATRPEAVVLKDASTLREAARVPLGSAAERRWGAPYLVVHRADLQSALLACVAREPAITLTMGAAVRDVALHGQGATTSVDHDGKVIEVPGLLLVAADGVWSSIRALSGEGGKSRFSGHVAWRRTLRAGSPQGQAFLSAAPADVVTAFMHPAFHLVVYPLRGGDAINLVALTKGAVTNESWSIRTDPDILNSALARAAPAISALAGDDWTAWPIHTVGPKQKWTSPQGLALIGDAAHAMTPFAAQGAAMGIEDAATLAALVAASPEDIATALRRYEAARRPRIAQVIKRGAFNRFAWHAGGPVAVARDLVLKARGPRRLAADLDWLYGWQAERTANSK
jgi:salicylate hydroxylase